MRNPAWLEENQKAKIWKTEDGRSETEGEEDRELRQRAEAGKQAEGKTSQAVRPSDGRSDKARRDREKNRKESGKIFWGLVGEYRGDGSEMFIVRHAGVTAVHRSGNRMWQIGCISQSGELGGVQLTLRA